MVQFNDWFDENVKPSHLLCPFVTWLENKGIQGIYDASFEPQVLEEEWMSFLFYLGRLLNRHGGLMEENPVYEIAEPLQNSIEIGESTKGLQVKSIKRYFGGYEKDWKWGLQQVFAMYDEARKLIKEREG